MHLAGAAIGQGLFREQRQKLLAIKCASSLDLESQILAGLGVCPLGLSDAGQRAAWHREAPDLKKQTVPVAKGRLQGLRRRGAGMGPHEREQLELSEPGRVAQCSQARVAERTARQDECVQVA